MKARSHCILLMACLLLISTSYADPENFMVESITFDRPASWEWVVPDSEVRKAQLKVYNQNKTESADIIFYWFPTEDKQGDPEGCTKRWRAQFRDKNVPITIERSTFGKCKVLYAYMEGIYKGFGKEGLSLADHALCGCVIQTDKGSIMVRMTGPKGIVNKASAPFKKMIEDALKEE